MHLGYSRPGPAETVIEVLSQMGSAGYDGLQLKGNQYLPWLEHPESFRERFDASQIMGGIAYGDDARNVQRTIDFAGVLGWQAVTWVPAWKKGQIDYATAADILNRLGGHAKEKGTALSLHHHAGQLFEDGDDLNQFCQLVVPEDVGLTIDTAHLALGGAKDIPAVIRACQGYISLFHIKDLQDRQFCPLGRGELDFNAIFQAIREIGFDGWLIVDDESDQMTVQEALPHGAQFIRRYLSP